MTLLEALAAALLLLGSTLVLYAVWSADGAGAPPVEARPPGRQEEAPLRRAA